MNNIRDSFESLKEWVSDKLDFSKKGSINIKQESGAVEEKNIQQKDAHKTGFYTKTCNVFERAGKFCSSNFSVGSSHKITRNPTINIEQARGMIAEALNTTSESRFQNLSMINYQYSNPESREAIKAVIKQLIQERPDDIKKIINEVSQNKPGHMASVVPFAFICLECGLDLGGGKEPFLDKVNNRVQHQAVKQMAESGGFKSETFTELLTTRKKSPDWEEETTPLPKNVQPSPEREPIAQPKHVIAETKPAARSLETFRSDWQVKLSRYALPEQVDQLQKDFYDHLTSLNLKLNRLSARDCDEVAKACIDVSLKITPTISSRSNFVPTRENFKTNALQFVNATLGHKAASKGGPSETQKDNGIALQNAILKHLDGELAQAKKTSTS